ncbi:MAG: hypothetical protein QXN96_06620 [Candidatus Bathyarchaeia archaeon]
MLCGGESWRNCCSHGSSPQEEVFEIEDFHVKEVQKNKEALALLKAKLMMYLENAKTEVLCCPYALRRLMTTP